MNIIKVIVDEVPEGCMYCILSHQGDHFWGCRIYNKPLSHDWTTRPDWCPLVTVPKCIMNDILMSEFLSSGTMPQGESEG